jgi:hypothetical protein
MVKKFFSVATFSAPEALVRSLVNDELFQGIFLEFGRHEKIKDTVVSKVLNYLKFKIEYFVNKFFLN